MYEARIVLDSLAPCGKRLTTFEITFPRMVLAEFNTHRVFSRNSASSRAIPVEKMLKKALEDAFIPFYWGKNQKGMSADEELSSELQMNANDVWIKARDNAIESAKALMDLGVHKQIANRLLEPFLYHTVICSATEYSNFFKLRCDKNAAPEIQKIAFMMRDLYENQKPQEVEFGYWHLPFITDLAQLEADGFTPEDIRKICTGRVARVSYLTHNGTREPKADVDLTDRLIGPGHWSPFEHVAMAQQQPCRSGNFIGWLQYREYMDPDMSHA